MIVMIYLDSSGILYFLSHHHIFSPPLSRAIRYYDLYGDIAKLDKNSNMIPCESLPGAPSLQKKK